MPSEQEWVVIGVSGVTCSGKTTVAKALHSVFPGSVILHQDKYFLSPDDPQQTLLPSLGHCNWEIASSLDMAKMTSDIREILTRPATEIVLPLLIIEGFLIFTDPYISSVCRHKVFLTLSHEECWARRSVRTYDPPDPPGYFEQVVWPEYERHLQLALTINPNLTLVSGTQDTNSVVQQIRDALPNYLEHKCTKS